MAKPFFEVFPTLELHPDLQKLFSDMEVERLSQNPSHTMLRVYLSGRRLIPHDQILRLEQEIAAQIFQGQALTIKIYEKYTLSKQYTPETLFQIYGESIRKELQQYSMLMGQAFRTAKLEFDRPDHLILTLEDTIISRERGEELISILEKIVCERCGLQLRIEAAYQQPEKKNLDAEQKIRQEIASIVSHTTFAPRGEALEDTVEPLEAGEAFGEKTGAPADAKERAREAGEGAAMPKEPASEQRSQKGKGSDRKPLSNRSRRTFSRVRSDDPNVLYGRDVEEESVPISQIEDGIGEVTIRGQVVNLDSRALKKGERTLVIFTITDFTDTISCKMFLDSETEAPDLLKSLKKGMFLKTRGTVLLDTYDKELTLGKIRGIRKISDFTTARMDHSVKKRVELHCHTKMSDMDGVSEVADIIKEAAAWGHKAIAITDHGVVQAFPVANHHIPEGSDIKLIYGVEAYLVDDLKDIIRNPAGQSLRDQFVVFDLETTGLSPENCKIIEIGAVKVLDGKIVDRFSTFVNPKVPIPYRIEELTSINDAMVIDAPVISEILPDFLKFCEGAIMVAHNAEFDMSFIEKNCRDLGLPCDYTVADTVTLAQFLLPKLNRFKLDTVARAVGVSLEHHHRAVDDAACTAEIFVKFIEMLRGRGIETLEQLNEAAHLSEDLIRKLKSHHAIILAINDIGRVNLYQLVSLSHVKYFYHKHPLVPKSEVMKHREGLLLGSACEAGELYQALLSNRPEEEIARLVRFYDYLEIQPVGNNRFMIADERYGIRSEEEIRDINRRIVKLGEAFQKPVVATCDVHFLHPEDEVYRRIIMTGNGFKDADEQAPLYLHTTEEMLEEFSYLGSEQAEEIVITNPNRIADCCDRIAPVRPDKCPPVIENSDELLRTICYNKAHEMYGDPLPKPVEERLERELKSIIGNGYAVMYIIAQKLVWKSNEDGYLVGSRGSVGSSFAATMAGITEVNPLHAHYYCANCHYSDFDSEEVRAFDGRSGCDMPDKQCPVCGALLKKDGFDIPFETFLGFKGDKEPDIDLNFSGDYQAKAHAYTEVIFGYEQTYRAGTIGTLADKTAFGYVKNYYEEHGVQKRNCEIDRIVQGCVGVRRTTGQHPGGIVVLPMGEEINSFTPIQHPANDMETDIVTTHFEYHSIDHNLLKLDILGHDDPTMIRLLEDLTGLDAREIPLDDPAVMTLFQNTDAIGVTPEEIGGCEIGALGIPEFGTDFAMQMLIDTKPKEFSDLVRNSGLSHGTDVYLGNAKDLILSGQATISTAICTRDDIMTYLIHMGLDPAESFQIMEAVRKGKVAKGAVKNWTDWKADMKAHEVPDWYIGSCEKIKYMFPKAHAAAYVMMAWRIAYCKVYYPLAYYAAFFSIRATGFSYELMCQGKEKLEYHIEGYKRRADSLSNKEQDELRDMRIVQEMYARGFTFLPIDLYRADAKYFRIIDGKLMPSIGSISGVGPSVAEQIQKAAKEGPFLSRDDFRERTKASSTLIEKMQSLGLFGDLPESNQMSLFDFA